jgi:subtilisin family serine protease
LSDALLSFSKLLELLNAMPAESSRLVVNNSWGMYDPAWDFPVGHPGNYSDNLQHPFNVIVRTISALGADVLFAAGNCGAPCPASKCKYKDQTTITGANSHPSVYSVAGVDVSRTRVGYSSQGPGRLENDCPTISSYTHFAGSGVYPADNGTSAASPVLAGLLAAIRTVHSASALPTQQLRSLVCSTADDLGTAGFDYDHGWGTPNTKALLATLP